MRYLLIVLLFCSCMTQKKMAQKCAEKFPVRESTVIIPGAARYDTTYIAGDTLVFSDTVRIDCDTVKGVITKTIYKEKACPPERLVLRHQVDTFRITKVDMAAVEVEKIRADEAEQKVERLIKGRDLWRWISIGCFLIIGGAIFSKIKGFI